MAVKTVFMFPGQGSQHFQMGRQLFDTHPVFRQWMTRLDDLARTLCGQSVIDAVYGSSRSAVFDRTLLTHPAIFMVEYSLAQCLMHENVRPDLTMSASLGSFAAAAVAGHVDVEEALAAVVQQAVAFEDSCQPGGMVAILADPALFDEPFLKARSELAGVNFKGHFVVSAPREELGGIESALKQRGVIHQRLAVSFAFHSRWVEFAREKFSSSMRSIARRRGALPLVCCEQGATLTALPDDFFWRVVRHPIRFRQTLAHLEHQGRHRYLDIGPSGTLATFVKYGLAEASGSTAHAILTPYGQDRKNLAAVLAPS